jgi:hypothetical protein
MDPAAHENVLVRTGVLFNLLKRFIDPIDAISAIDGQSLLDPFRR